MQFSFFVQLFLSIFFFNMILSANECCPENGCREEKFYEWCQENDHALAFSVAGDISLGYDNFRGLPDGSWNGNTGGFIATNIGTDLPFLSCYGLGVQLGASYGLYDWSGRGSVPGVTNDNDLQQQGFVSVGIFRKTHCCYGLNWGIIYDWMINKNLGVFASSSEFDQMRFQAGYLIHACDEFGFWGTAALRTWRRDSLRAGGGTHFAGGQGGRRGANYRRRGVERGRGYQQYGRDDGVYAPPAARSPPKAYGRKAEAAKLWMFRLSDVSRRKKDRE